MNESRVLRSTLLNCPLTRLRYSRRSSTNSVQAWSSPLKFSILQALFLITFVAVSFAALRLGGVVVSLATVLAAVFVVAQSINAFVASGPTRAFAIGFVIAIASCLTVLGAFAIVGIAPNSEQHPTAGLIRSFYGVLSRDVWVNAATREELPSFIPNANGRSPGGGPGLGPGGVLVERISKPDFAGFTIVFHVILYVIVGYIGGKYATIVWARHYAAQ